MTDLGRVLERGLAAAAAWEGAPAGSKEADAAAERATAALVLLHSALARGAELPAAWARARIPSPVPAPREAT